MFGEPPTAASQLLLVVEDALYDAVAPELHRYSIEAGYQGFAVTIRTMPASTEPQELRSLLQSYHSHGLEGCVLIGNFTAPTFEMSLAGVYEQFPIDLYFMDLDGTFLDTDGNGVLDWHSGPKEPDIFLGRLYPSTLYGFGNATDLLKAYFARNSLYRRGQLQVPQRVLTFIDDDWIGESWTWHAESSSVYPEGKLVNKPAETVAAAYLQELAAGYEFVLVGVHSNPQTHSFKSGATWTYVTSRDIFDLHPPVLFANLFACSAADYRVGNCLASAYVFGDAGPLAVVASTKTGSMYDFAQFYEDLAAGQGLGIALQHWLETAVYPTPEMPESPGWSYGLTCMGDPTLPIALNRSDPDHDGLPIFWENLFGLNPAFADGAQDSDGDGLSNHEEFTIFSNPRNPDTDGDQMPDGWEYRNHLDSLQNDSAGDADHDGLANYFEYLWQTDPHNPDTDGDGLTDGEEVRVGTSPTLADTDFDGLIDSVDSMPTIHWALVVVPIVALIAAIAVAVTTLHRRHAPSSSQSSTSRETRRR
jgi:hypothetical protein